MAPTTKTPSVDDVLAEATDEAPQTRATPLEPFTFRTDPELRTAAENVCARHGVSLPAFLRAAQRKLVDTYGG